MERLEQALAERGTGFFRSMENQAGMLDYMIWPWLERIEVVPLIFSDIDELLPSSKFPLLVR